MAKNKKKELTAVEMTFDAKAIADALNLTESVVVNEFRDGRVASRFTEHWGAKIYGYLKHKNTNASDSDGQIKAGDLPNALTISVKSLTKSGVKFQHSKFIGSGRGCTFDDLKDSIKSVDLYLIVDISEFPELIFLPIRSVVLLSWVKEDKLTPRGLSKRAFYENLSKDYSQILIDGRVWKPTL